MYFNMYKTERILYVFLKLMTSEFFYHTAVLIE
jgi:hypothetical protein